MNLEMLKLKAIQTGLQFVGYVSTPLSARIAQHLFLTPQKFKRPGWEAELLKTAQETFEVDGSQVWSWGQGQPVLLVHGWAGRGSQLGKFVQPLVEKGYRALLFDGPAHGSSPKKQTNIREFSDVILKIGQRVGPLKAIVGHSFGGNSSVVALHRGLQSERVVILASPSDVESVFKSFSDFLHLSPKTRSTFQLLVEENVRWPASQISPVKLATARTEPLLIVHDRKDPEVDFSHAQKIAKAWSPSRLVEVEGEGHYRILKSSKVINSVIEFLKND